MSYNSANVLRRGASGLSVIEKVCLICEKVKGNACRYFKTIKTGINPAFYAWIVIKSVAVEVAEL